MMTWEKHGQKRHPLNNALFPLNLYARSHGIHVTDPQVRQSWGGGGDGDRDRDRDGDGDHGRETMGGRYPVPELRSSVEMNEIIHGIQSAFPCPS
jgi:hypothetical protein